MIVCRKCSRRYADDVEFCACGAYLAFDGERVAETGATPAPPPAGPMPPPAAGPVPTQPVPSGWTEPVTRREVPQASEPAPWSGLPGTSTSSSTSSVDARLPDVPVDAVTEPIWVEQGGRAGDIACSRCRTPNSPERQFCKHCGQPLTGGSAAAIAPETAHATVPWWRRLTRSARRRARALDPNALAMDARRMSAGGLSSRTMAFRTGGITVLLMGLLAFLGPWRGTVIAQARTLLGGKQYVAISPDHVEAETVTFAGDGIADALPQQIATNVLDRHANTAWATHWLNAVEAGAAPAPAAGECVTETRTDSALRFTFDEETDIDRIEVLGGRYAEDESRTLYSRPRLVEVEIDGRCSQAELPDTGELSAIDLRARDVTQVVLRIVDVHAEDESSAVTEISEVVFERRR